MKTIILDSTRIDRTLHRMAYQILEHCHKEKEVIIFGIEPRGGWVAERLVNVLKNISDLKITLKTISDERVEEIEELGSLVSKKAVVLVDDVINSGKTMMVCASGLMRHEPRVLYTGSLVDREHRRYPIQSDFTGLSLATTLQEHIQLVIDPEPTIYLE